MWAYIACDIEYVDFMMSVALALQKELEQESIREANKSEVITRETKQSKKTSIEHDYDQGLC